MVVKIWIGTQIDGIVLDIMNLNTMESRGESRGTVLFDYNSIQKD